MTIRDLLKVAAPLAVVLTMLASGTLAYSACPNSERQDVDSILRAFAWSWRNDDFVTVRATEALLSDPDLRARTGQLVLFGEARAAIKKDDFGTASRILRRLEAGPKRALIAAALARRYKDPETLGKRWLQIALSDVDRLPEAQRNDVLAILLPVVIEADAGLGLRLLDTAIHAQTAAGPKRTTEQPRGAVIVAAGAQLLEVLPGRTSRHVFVLGIPGMSRPDLRDLAVAHHANLRCVHPARRNMSGGGQRTAGGRLLLRPRNSD